MRSAGFRCYNLRKSRKSSPPDIEPVPVPPAFQHPHHNLPDIALAALQADAWNLKFALSGPVWDHSLSNQFSQECLDQFQFTTASRLESPSPPPSMRSSQISPRTTRPVAALKQREIGQRKDSLIDREDNMTGIEFDRSQANQETVRITENARRHSSHMPYSNDISYTHDTPSPQFEVTIQDSDSEFADDETSQTSEDSNMSVSSDQLNLRRYRGVRDELRRYEFDGPPTAGKVSDNGQKRKSAGRDLGETDIAGQMSNHRQRRESAPSPSPVMKKRRLNSWGAYRIYR